MNEAEPSPINLDELRMVPDWLREDAPASSKQYAAHDYPVDDDRSARRGPPGSRPGGFGGRGGGDRRDARGGPDRRREGAGRPGQGGGPRGGTGRGPRDDRRSAPTPPPAPAAPAPVKVEFVPDERCLASINKQIRATHMAYPLFGLARMFLQEPERHFVQFTVKPDAEPGTSLYQLGEDGPVTLDRTILEKLAFEGHKDRFYTEQSVQKEPLKGNFTNVARERLSGTLLGPTNYHGYQPALRSLYEARYSRRMSFEDFRRNIEVSNDPALVERWKEEARTTTTIATKVAEGETPVELASAADARAHFRQHHLETLLRSGTTFKVHGSVARKLPEPAMMRAIREAHDTEMRYPAQFVQLLRQGLQDSGLHIFKHRKRVVYVSLARPTPFVARGTVSPNVAAILETVAQNPLCTRKALAEKVLARGTAMPEESESLTELRTGAAATIPGEPSVPESTEDAGTAGAVSTEAETAISATERTPEAPEATLEADAPEPSSTAAVPVSTDSAPEPAPAAKLPEDPVARAKAALAADLRFLVQSGHIIEFHNGTFDLPLPPKAKEDQPSTAGPKPPGRNRANPPGKQGNPPTGIIEAASNSADPVASAPEGAATYTAGDDGVAETGGDPMAAGEATVPSLLDVREPAPTAENLTGAPDREDAPENPDEIEILPPDPSAVSVDPAEDKSNHDGLISGPGAAPLDLPVPGDTEDAPNPGRP